MRERICGIDDVVVIIGPWICDLYALLDHLPSFWINQDGNPAAATVVAAPIRKHSATDYIQLVVIGCE